MLYQEVCHAVKQRHEVGAHCVVVIGAEEEHGITVLDGGENFLGDGPSVKAGVVLGIVEAGGIGAAPAVLDGAVLQRDLLAGEGSGELGQDLPSHPHGVGMEVVRGVEHQDPGLAEPGELEGQHPLGQLPDPAAVGLLPTQAKLGRQDVLVIEGACPLHQGLAGEGTAGQVGRHHQGLGRLLGVELSGAVHHHPGGAASQSRRVLAQPAHQGVKLPPGPESVHTYGEQEVVSRGQFLQMGGRKPAAGNALQGPVQQRRQPGRGPRLQKGKGRGSGHTGSSFLRVW